MRVNLIYEMDAFGITAGGVTSAVRYLKAALNNHGIDVMENAVRGYDVLHIHTVGPRALYKLLMDDAPKVITAHTIPHEIPYLFKFGNFLAHFALPYLRFLYNLADVVIAPSQFAKEKLREIGISKRIEVISNGVDTNYFRHSKEKGERFRRRYNLEKRIVGCLGLPSDRKGLLTFIDVARGLPEFDFVWAGKNVFGPFLKDSADIVKALMEVPENFIYLGFVDDVLEFYSGIDIFMLPTKIETEGLTILEAASTGKPIVVSDIECFSWLVHGESCLKSKSTGEFIRCLKMLDDRDLYLKVSRGAREMAEQRDIMDTSKKIVEVYRSLLK